MDESPFEGLDGLVETGDGPSSDELSAALTGRRRSQDRRKVRMGAGALAIVLVAALLAVRLGATDPSGDETTWSAEATAIAGEMTPECVNLLAGRWGRGTDVVVFMDVDADGAAIDGVRTYLDDAVGADRVLYVDQQAAYEEFVDLFRDQPEMVASVYPAMLPPSFRVAAGDDEQVTSQIDRDLKDTAGVREIVLPSNTIELLSRADPDTVLAGDPLYAVVTPRVGVRAAELADQVGEVVGGAASVQGLRSEEVVTVETSDRSLGAVLGLLDELHGIDGVAAAEISTRPAVPSWSASEMDPEADDPLLACIGDAPCPGRIDAGWVDGAEVVVFAFPEADQPTLDSLRARIEDLAGDGTVAVVDRQQAYEEFVDLFRDQPDMIDTVRPETLPVSFRVDVGGDEAVIDLIEAAMREEPAVQEVVRPPAGIQPCVGDLSGSGGG